MVLTPVILRNLYAALYSCRPFSTWDMPLPEEIKFVVNADPERMGTYMYEPDSETFCHELTISREHHSHLATVIRTLAHEMIHMRRHKTSRWDQHDAVFRRYAHQIAQELGFDPLEL